MPLLVLLILCGLVGPSAVLSLPAVLSKAARVKRLCGSSECSDLCRHYEVDAQEWRDARSPVRFPCAWKVCGALFLDAAPLCVHCPVSSFQLVAARREGFPDAVVAQRVARMLDFPAAVVEGLPCRACCGALRTVEASARILQRELGRGRPFSPSPPPHPALRPALQSDPGQLG